MLTIIDLLTWGTGCFDFIYPSIWIGMFIGLSCLCIRGGCSTNRTLSYTLGSRRWNDAGTLKSISCINHSSHCGIEESSCHFRRNPSHLAQWLFGWERSQTQSFASWSLKGWRSLVLVNHIPAWWNSLRNEIWPRYLTYQGSTFATWATD
jgi:hypothetical protein